MPYDSPGGRVQLAGRPVLGQLRHIDGLGVLHRRHPLRELVALDQLNKCSFPSTIAISGHQLNLGGGEICTGRGEPRESKFSVPDRQTTHLLLGRLEVGLLPDHDVVLVLQRRLALGHAVDRGVVALPHRCIG
eukprot:SAG22_NODE_2654_length_2333_cov_207.686213_3_plen_133_part_00